ncbi:MAG: hypothetical protein KC420_15765 [Myxococcales bacterium]|nr:hypothetical protein [Myxococcales bacterium]MCB9569804.1 hypothetical protein [Myxococcales bacterium]MCB9706399.1 hypothetical protein [Myxococcales bacterium]
MTMPRWDLWRRELYLWTLTLTGAALPLAWLLWTPGQALSVAAGALLGLANLHLLGRSAFRMVEAPPRDLEDARRPRFAPLMALVRWPLAALATAFVLWYMAGQPEGLAVGVSLAFLGFVIAGLRSAPADEEIDD